MCRAGPQQNGACAGVDASRCVPFGARVVRARVAPSIRTTLAPSRAPELNGTDRTRWSRPRMRAISLKRRVPRKPAVRSRDSGPFLVKTVIFLIYIYICTYRENQISLRDNDARDAIASPDRNIRGSRDTYLSVRYVRRFYRDRVFVDRASSARPKLLRMLRDRLARYDSRSWYPEFVEEREHRRDGLPISCLAIRANISQTCDARAMIRAPSKTFRTRDHELDRGRMFTATLSIRLI